MYRRTRIFRTFWWEVKKPWLLFKARGNDSLVRAACFSLSVAYLPENVDKKIKWKNHLLFLVGMVKAELTVCIWIQPYSLLDGTYVCTVHGLWLPFWESGIPASTFLASLFRLQT